MLDIILKKKLALLKNSLRELESVVVAFSGGVDSALLSAIAVETLGRDSVVLATAESETFTGGERKRAAELAADFGASHVILKTDELADDNFSKNPPDRCYFCKKELFLKLNDLRKQHGFKFIIDGTNTDDAKDYRPGGKAAIEMEVRSPFLDSGMTKNDVRAVSKEMGLSTWNLPAQACLASRIPYGMKIDKVILKRIEDSETAIKNITGIASVRVRHHGDIARIETDPKDFQKLLDENNRLRIASDLKSFGYYFVTLDIQGYRIGSMNELL